MTAIPDFFSCENRGTIRGNKEYIGMDKAGNSKRSQNIDVMKAGGETIQMKEEKVKEVSRGKANYNGRYV